MNIYELIYSRLLRREYPLIKIGKEESPFWRSLPDSIYLCLTKSGRRRFAIETEEEVFSLTECSLEHEFLHFLLYRMFGRRTTKKLDNISAWSRSDKCGFLGMGRTHTKKSLFHTRFGYLTYKEIKRIEGLDDIEKP